MILSHITLLLQLPNYKCRVYTDDFVSGNYAIQFYYHAYGPGIGGMDVSTRPVNSSSSKIAWIYTNTLNGTANRWIKTSLQVNKVESFKVC